MGRSLMRGLGAFGLGMIGGAGMGYLDYAREQRRAGKEPTFGSWMDSSEAGRFLRHGRTDPIAQPPAKVEDATKTEVMPPPVDQSSAPTGAESGGAEAMPVEPPAPPVEISEDSAFEDAFDEFA